MRESHDTYRGTRKCMLRERRIWVVEALRRAGDVCSASPPAAASSSKDESFSKTLPHLVSSSAYLQVTRPVPLGYSCGALQKSECERLDDPLRGKPMIRGQSCSMKIVYITFEISQLGQ